MMLVKLMENMEIMRKKHMIFQKKIKYNLNFIHQKQLKMNIKRNMKIF
jgi:hypothetical protein